MSEKYCQNNRNICIIFEVRRDKNIFDLHEYETRQSVLLKNKQKTMLFYNFSDHIDNYTYILRIRTVHFISTKTSRVANFIGSVVTWQYNTYYGMVGRSEWSGRIGGVLRTCAESRIPYSGPAPLPMFTASVMNCRTETNTRRRD